MRGDFAHPALDEEVRAIGGGYTWLREAVVSFDGAPLLYLVGVGELDTSCCGEGGCGYALVAGHLEAYRARDGAEGDAVSRVRSITDAATRRRIASHIRETELVQEVQFWSPKEEDP